MASKLELLPDEVLDLMGTLRDLQTQYKRDIRHEDRHSSRQNEDGDDEDEEKETEKDEKEVTEEESPQGSEQAPSIPTSFNYAQFYEWCEAVEIAEPVGGDKNADKSGEKMEKEENGNTKMESEGRDCGDRRDGDNDIDGNGDGDIDYAVLADCDWDSDDVLQLKATLRQRHQYVQAVVNQTNDCLKSIDKLAEFHADATAKTATLHLTCADLLKEQERLDGVIDSLSMPLSFFEDFEEIGKKLGLPLVIETKAERRVVDNTSAKSSGKATKDRQAMVAKAKAMSVRDVHTIDPSRPEFASLLERLNECIRYTKAHLHFHDSPQYLEKYYLLHTRALSLIRQNLETQLEALVTGEEEETGVHADPSKRRASGAHMRASMGRLEFHKLAKDMRAQLLHMQRAAAPSAASLFDLGTLEDNLDIQLQCNRLLVDKRVEFVQPIIEEQIEMLNRECATSTQGTSNTGAKVNLPDFARRGFALLMKTAIEEYSLFIEFFPSVTNSGDLIPTSRSSTDENNADPSDTFGAAMRDAFKDKNKVNKTEKNEHNLYEAGSLSAVAATAVPTEMFENMMDGLFAGLYDKLRENTISEQSLDVQCELIEVLIDEVLHGMIPARKRAMKIDDREDTTSSATLSLSRSDTSMLMPLEGVQRACRAVLADAQERLIYLSSTFIENVIVGFSPEKDDLDYPNKLVRYREEQARKQKQNDANDDNSSKDGEGIGDSGKLNKESISEAKGLQYTLWYPPLDKTLNFLSTIYRCIENEIFQKIAQQAISVCSKHFLTAARIVSANADVLDGDLFLIKHLLILREQISPFQISMAVTEQSLDFTTTTEALGTLLGNMGGMFRMDSTNSILHFWATGLPVVTKQNIDSKSDLEQALKIACETFILHATRDITAPLLSLLEKEAKLAGGGSSGSGSSDALEKRERELVSQALEALNQMSSTMKRDAAKLQSKMKVYLANEVTQSILFKPIRRNILEGIEQIMLIVGSEVRDSGSASVKEVLDKATKLQMDAHALS